MTSPCSYIPNRAVFAVNVQSLPFSWLYKEATVQDVDVNADDGSAVVKVVISAAAYGRYKKLFSGR